MIRSSALSWVGAVALIVMETFGATAASDHVGILTDMSGAYSAITGKGSAVAARLAIEDFGGELLGKPIELVVADHTAKPDVAANLARQWYDNDGVDAIFDGAGSSVAIAILELARSRNKIVAFSGVVSPDVTGKLCGDTISSWAWDTYAMVATSLEPLMRLGGKRVFFVTLDSTVGRLLEGDATQIVRAAGGTILGSVKHPLNSVDFSSFLLQAQAARPDVIVFANAGNDTVNAIKQAGEFGLTSGAKPITHRLPALPMMGFAAKSDKGPICSLYPSYNRSVSWHRSSGHRQRKAQRRRQHAMAIVARRFRGSNHIGRGRRMG